MSAFGVNAATYYVANSMPDEVLMARASKQRREAGVGSRILSLIAWTDYLTLAASSRASSLPATKSVSESFNTWSG